MTAEAAVDRSTAPDRRLPPLDGLRALAALAVLLAHVAFQTGLTTDVTVGTLGDLASRLELGVTLFFLLSGFLLYRPYAQAHLAGRPVPVTRTYLRNRALRVLPAYWLLVVVALPLLTPSVVSAGELLQQGLLLQTLQEGHLHQGLTQTWSLAVEVAFYLVLPLLAWTVRPGARTGVQQLRAEGVLLAAMLAVSVAWQVAVHAGGLGDERITGLWLPGYLDWFALGMGLAVLRTWADVTGGLPRLRSAAGAAGSWLLVAALLVWLSAGPLGGPRGLEPVTAWESLARHVLYGAACAALLLPVVLADRPTGWHRVLSSPLARWLGRMSYGVFLWHLVALDLVFRLPGLDPFSGRTLLVTALVVPLSLALAAVSHRLVEEPALRLKRSAVPAAARPPAPRRPAAPAPARRG